MRKITKKTITYFPLFSLTICIFSFFCGCRERNSEVVIYTSLDQTFSEPILTLFEEKTSITVRAVYDIEAAKTIGLVNRLVAESANPQADVFWSSEIVQTIYLKKEGILAPYDSPSAKTIPEPFKDIDGFWTGFAARARVIAYDPEVIDPEDIPATIGELTAAKWKDQVAIANPLFGTTSTHAAVLFAHLGRERAMGFFLDLKKNGVKIVSGNAHARDLVLRGKTKLCLTDTDDVVSARDRGETIEMIFPDGETVGTLLIPNTVALIKNGPHPDEAKRLIDFILSPEVEQLLARSSSAQLPVRAGITPREEVSGVLSAKIMDVDFEQAYEHIVEANDFLKKQFISP